MGSHCGKTKKNVVWQGMLAACRAWELTRVGASQATRRGVKKSSCLLLQESSEFYHISHSAESTAKAVVSNSPIAKDALRRKNSANMQDVAPSTKISPPRVEHGHTRALHVLENLSIIQRFADRQIATPKQLSLSPTCLGSRVDLGLHAHARFLQELNTPL